VAHFPDQSHASDNASTVEAATAEGAINAAVEKFGITDPWQQQRLVAQRIVPGIAVRGHNVNQA
jgi:hypothetical protein